MTIQWTDWLSSISAGVVALIGIVGVVVANSRVRRATVRISGTVHGPPDGPVMRVTCTVKSAGLGKLTVPKDDSCPSIRLFEIRADSTGSTEHEIPLADEQRLFLEQDDVIYPQEDQSETKYILLPPVQPGVIGWKLGFDFQVHKRVHRPGGDNLWWWYASDFVPNDSTTLGGLERPITASR